MSTTKKGVHIALTPDLAGTTVCRFSAETVRDVCPDRTPTNVAKVLQCSFQKQAKFTSAATPTTTTVTATATATGKGTSAGTATATSMASATVTVTVSYSYSYS